MLGLGSGEVRAGRDLRDIVEQARGVAKVIEDVHSRYARFVVEQAAIGGAFDPKLLLSAEQANTVAAEIATAPVRHSVGDPRDLGIAVSAIGYVSP